MGTYFLVSGGRYVYENLRRPGEYLLTDEIALAKEFSYKQAKGLVQRGKNKSAWLRNCQLVDVESGIESNQSLHYQGSGGAYIGENDVNLDLNVIEEIEREAQKIMEISGWDAKKMSTYKNQLEIALSKTDSEISDVTHALEAYMREHDGKRPPAHKIAKITYLLMDVLTRRRNIKECREKISTMLDANTYKYDLAKLKSELSKIKHTEYKGRTDTYSVAMKILGDHI